MAALPSALSAITMLADGRACLATHAATRHVTQDTNWELQAVTSMPNGGRTADPDHLDELRNELRNELRERRAIQTVGSP